MAEKIGGRLESDNHELFSQMEGVMPCGGSVIARGGTLLLNL